MTDTNEPLGQEWITLQNNHAHYERGAILISGLRVLLFFR